MAPFLAIPIPAPVCPTDEQLSGPSGFINSPIGEDGKYPNNQNCAWTITVMI